jgi:Na+/H+-dicarboxylate symporter
MKIVGFIMYFAPIGLGAYFANLIGDLGPSLIGDFGKTLAVYYPLIFLYMAIMFPIYAYYAGGKPGITAMRKNILSPAATAFGTQSSVATLPVNKKACDNIGIPSDVSNLVLPMGATMHMDGSVISAIVKISFLFSIYQMDFVGLDTYLMAIVVAVLSAFVLSGAPGGGLVGEMLIVSLFGFPPEAFPLIATIGFLVDPGATMLNASGDTVVSMMVAKHAEGKKWMKKGRDKASA